MKKKVYTEMRGTGYELQSLGQSKEKGQGGGTETSEF